MIKSNKTGLGFNQVYGNLGSWHNHRINKKEDVLTFYAWHDCDSHHSKKNIKMAIHVIFFIYIVLISSVVKYSGKKKKILYESPFEGWSN